MLDRYGSAMPKPTGSRTTRAIESVRWVTRLRAARFGTYPRRAIAVSTASRIAAVTGAESLITRETVAGETPATAATVARVGCPPEVRELEATVLVLLRLGPGVCPTADRSGPFTIGSRVLSLIT